MPSTAGASSLRIGAAAAAVPASPRAGAPPGPGSAPASTGPEPTRLSCHRSLREVADSSARAAGGPGWPGARARAGVPRPAATTRGARPRLGHRPARGGTEADPCATRRLRPGRRAGRPGPGDADAVAQPVELLGIDRVYGEAAVQKSIHHRSMRHLNRHRDRARVARSRHEPIAQGRQARPAMGERPLAHNFASPIEQAYLVLCRAPVDAGEPAECLISHGPVLSCPTSRHDACRNLYGRSRARLPTGHPSWPTCRGTGPTLVLVARVRNWSLPTGRLARSAYTGTDRALPDTGAKLLPWAWAAPRWGV